MGFIQNDDVLFLNGRWLMKYGEIPLVAAWLCPATSSPAVGNEKVGLKSGEIVYIRAKRQNIEENKADTLPELLNNLKNSLPQEEMDTLLLSYPWELINRNAEAMEWDFEFFGNSGIYGKFAEYAVVWGDKEKVFVADTAEVQPFVALDTSKGPIYIDEGAKIDSHTRVEGPSYIGKNSTVSGAKVREGTSIGPICKVGGEVSRSIFHAYSNKAHDGYIGRSYIGEWVNLGALTTNSDLKNDYTTVRVCIKGEPIDSNEIKVGVFVGDHTKTGLGTLLSTGNIVGMMCSILPAAGKLLPKFIPSFTCFYKNEFSEGKGLEHNIEAVRTTMSRRGVELSGEDIELFKKLYELTSKEREKAMRVED